MSIYCLSIEHSCGYTHDAEAVRDRRLAPVLRVEHAPPRPRPEALEVDGVRSEDGHDGAVALDLLPFIDCQRACYRSPKEQVMDTSRMAAAAPSGVRS